MPPHIPPLPYPRPLSPRRSFTSKAGKPLVKRALTLVDATSTSVSVTLWGDAATEVPDNVLGTPLLLRETRVSDFGGCLTLSTGFSSSVKWHPVSKEALALQVSVRRARRAREGASGDRIAASAPCMRASHVHHTACVHECAREDGAGTCKQAWWNSGGKAGATTSMSEGGDEVAVDATLVAARHSVAAMIEKAAGGSSAGDDRDGAGLPPRMHPGSTRLKLRARTH